MGAGVTRLSPAAETATPRANGPDVLMTLRRTLTGAMAGAAGTIAMDLLWYRRYQADGGDDAFTDWAFATSTTSFEEAPAPGQVGKKAADVVGITLPDSRARLTTNVMHWITGMGYGVGHGLLWRDAGVTAGLLTGSLAFANSYGVLGALGVYEPIWTYDAETLSQDLSAHLVFGVATAVAYELLGGPHRGR